MHSPMIRKDVYLSQICNWIVYPFLQCYLATLNETESQSLTALKFWPITSQQHIDLGDGNSNIALRDNVSVFNIAQDVDYLYEIMVVDRETEVRLMTQNFHALHRGRKQLRGQRALTIV
eukprot:jgi/Galph1/5048/GphlegSOOS_G3792.1